MGTTIHSIENISTLKKLKVILGITSKNSMTKSKKMTGKRKNQAEKEYLTKRLRNNEAVRRSREKARIRADQTHERVKRLRKENESPEERLKLLTKELKFLKDVFKAHTGSNVKNVSNDTDEDDTSPTFVWPF